MMTGANRKDEYKMAMRHWKSEGLIPLVPGGGGLLLNLGSGMGGDKAYLTSRGFRVIALDTFASSRTSVVGDGHFLPFKDSVFDVAAAIKVLEHLHSPPAAVAEIGRVVKPGGYFIGSVAFLEPFHSESYFNMSHLGITHLLRENGFRVETLFPGWDFLQAFFRNFIPDSYRLRPFFKLAADLLLGIRGMGLRLVKGKAETEIAGVEKRFSAREIDRLNFAGSIAFKARKL